MAKIVFVALLYIILITKEVVSKQASNCDNFKECESCQICPLTTNNVELPVYTVVILGFIFIIMIITIIILSHRIYMMENKKIDVVVMPNTMSSITEGDYTRQGSCSGCDTTALPQMSTCNAALKNESTLSIFDETDSEIKDTKNREPLSPKVTKPFSVNNKMAAGNHIILPDQMHKICAEVLSKMKHNMSTSLTHLNEIQNDCKRDRVLTIAPAHDNASFSDFDEYDTVPQPIPLNDSENPDEIYDSPPQTHELMEMYKMPKPHEGPFDEYVNARTVLL